MTAIPEDLTPEMLREEAQRRELRDRAKSIADRRLARNIVIDAILAIDAKAVHAAGAVEALSTALRTIAKSDAADDEKTPSNGEISMAGPAGWWNQTRQETARVETHEMVLHIERGGYPSWPRG